MAINHQKLEGFFIDFTAQSVVSVCLHPGCNWRVIALNRLVAWELSAEHEGTVHPTQQLARISLRVAKSKESHFQH